MEGNQFRVQTEKLRLGFSRWGANHTGQILCQLHVRSPRGVMAAVGSGAPPSARTTLSPLAFVSFVEVEEWVVLLTWGRGE